MLYFKGTMKDFKAYLQQLLETFGPDATIKDILN